MSYRELIDALNKECEEKVRNIWQEAETEAERIRANARLRIEEMREKHERGWSAEAKALTDAIISKAKNLARATRLKAEKEISSRLYRIALSSIHHLREFDYGDVFLSLVQEIPPGSWRIARVNPEDSGLARECFPDAEIVPDSSIVAGLEVSEEKGGIVIVNTFEKRLERAWTEMLPEMLKDAYATLAGK